MTNIKELLNSIIEGIKDIIIFIANYWKENIVIFGILALASVITAIVATIVAGKK